MIRNNLKRVNFGIVLAILLFWAWYSVAADYDYDAVAGTYTLQRGGETSTLVLNKDRSFRQKLSNAGSVERAEGSWRRVGMGGIDFSKEFLQVSGQELCSGGDSCGVIEKKLGLFLSIKLGQDGNGPVFHKKLFR